MHGNGSYSNERASSARNATYAAASATLVLVCVGYNPSSQRLIRRAERLARAFGGQLLALHVAPQSTAPGYEVMVEENFALARSFGAETLIVPTENDLAHTIANVAARHSATHIVMGESARSRWEEVRNGSLVRQVLQASHGIDLYIVADEA
jgi:two-component system, OmpR family, sensor histidine kinase KdpD